MNSPSSPTLEVSVSSIEKIPYSIYTSATEGSRRVAREIADLISERTAKGQTTVLGLATGSTPTQIYDELARLHREEGLSFKKVVTFNLDEYYPMQPDALQSYVRFMHEYLFDRVDIPKENVHIPDGTLERDQIAAFCDEYERRIREAGGIDIQLLGVGRTGHIGFNEPGSTIDSKTRLIALDRVTMLDAASGFFGIENVPKQAITMGIRTIMSARKIYMLAWGEGKAGIIHRVVEGERTIQIPATFLQKHKDCHLVLDDASAAELTRVKTPWVLGHMHEWTPYMIKKAVIWLSLKLNKAILRLTEEDYREHGMGDILLEVDTAYNINIDVFNKIQHTITGWPGGKPNADDTHRPERKAPNPKRSLIFSPHPDDDVISMGGTFIRLVDQGHDVHVAYQTSGNIAVFDDDALRFADFVSDYHDIFKMDNTQAKSIFTGIRQFLATKEPGQVDSDELKEIKGLIRKAEAKAACRYVGLDDAHIHFLDLPFYETGRIRKKPLGEEDIRITKELITSIKPHQIFAAGDLSDPHGTHRVCLEAIFRALRELKKEGAAWLDDCYVWLYRGAWQEWGIEDIEMAVPLSPQETDRKRRAIFKHQSQKDRPLFPGADSREFWQRADERTQNTAKLYNALGMAEYEAIEAFVRWKDLQGDAS